MTTVKARTKRPRTPIRRILLAAYPQNWLGAAGLFTAGYWMHGLHFGIFWAICVLYFLSPYNLLMFAINSSLPITHDSGRPDYFWRFALIANVPFWIYFWLSGSAKANLVSVVVLGLLALVGAAKRRMNGMPGVDIIIAGMLSVLPFLWGVFHAHGNDVWWMPGLVALYLAAVATWAFYDLAMIAPDMFGHVKTFATRFGSETTLMICLGLYIVAAILPTVYYHVYGIVPSLIGLSFVSEMARVIPFRAQASHPIFPQTQWRLVRASYLAGLTLGIYFMLLYLFR